MLYLTLAGVLVMAGPDVEVSTLDGNAVEGQILQLTADELELGGDEPQKIDLSNVLNVTVKNPAAGVEVDDPIRVQLVDGSRLLATRYSVAEGKASVAIVGGDVVTLPTRSIHSVRIQPQTDDVDRQWDEIEDSELEGDTLVLRKTIDDAATGVPVESLDFLEGIFYDVTDAAVQFEFDGDRVDVPRKKVEGLIYFHPAGRALPDTLCRVFDVSGSQLHAQSVQLTGDAAEVTLVSGPTCNVALASLKRIDFSSGRIVFLSDLDPTSVEWTSYLDVSRTLPSLARLYKPRADRSFSGDKLRLRVAGQVEEFPKGLAIHSRTTLVYNVPPEMRTFKALAGIDDSVRTGGHVRLVIRGDNKVLVDQPVTIDQKPLPIDADVTGVRRLKILVDFGEQLDIGDSLNLCNARLTK